LRRHDLAVALLVPALLAADWISKRWIEANVDFFDTHIVIPGFFSIIHTQNRGAAFSLLDDAPEAVRAFFLIGVSGVVTAVVAWMLYSALRKQSPLRATLPLALILAGALGNMYDRVRAGVVTDFLLLYYKDWQWPAFNVADSAISVGAVLLLAEMLKPGGGDAAAAGGQETGAS
jgi:signal peptidase II